MSQLHERIMPGYPKPPKKRNERTRIYMANEGSISEEQRNQFAGQWIAIRWDNLIILDGDPDLLRLEAKLRDSGIDPEDAIFSQVHLPDAILIEHGSEIEIVHESDDPSVFRSLT